MGDTQKGIEVRFNMGGRKVRLGGYVMPERYSVRINDQAYPYVAELEVVVEGGRVACESIRLLRREGGPPIQGATLRLPIAGILRHTAPVVALRVVNRDKGKWAPVGEEDLEGFYETFRKQERRSGRRPITEDTLRRVAKAYRSALQTGAPVEAVRRSFDPEISRSHAGRLVMRARRQRDPRTGKPYLGPTKPGQPGEGRK